MQLSSFQLSSVSPKQTTEGSEQRCSLFLRVSNTDHISPHLASLHSLPTDSWIQYKLSSHCYNCLNSTAPDYLTEPLRIYKPTRQLCSSSDTSILCLPSVRTLSWSEVIFLCCTVCLEHSPLRNQILKTPSHPSNQLLKLIFSSSPTDCERARRTRAHVCV